MWQQEADEIDELTRSVSSQSSGQGFGTAQHPLYPAMSASLSCLSGSSIGGARRRAAGPKGRLLRARRIGVQPLRTTTVTVCIALITWAARPAALSCEIDRLAARQHLLQHFLDLRSGEELVHELAIRFHVREAPVPRRVLKL